MPKGGKLFRSLAALMLRRSCGTATIGLEIGNVTHVKTETRRTWRYRSLSDERDRERPGGAQNA